MIATSSPFIRTLVIYAVVLPLALFLGYLLATPLTYSSMVMVGIALGMLSVPLLLKWHFALLVLSLNVAAVVPFVSGHPEWFLFTPFLSLLIVWARRCLILNMRFIYAPSIVLPLLAFMAVVFVTGRLTHSFGLRIMGSGTVGSRYYLNIFAGAACMFAMLAVRIPRDKAQLYVNFYLLGGLVNIVTSLFKYLPAWAQYVQLIIPVNTTDAGLSDSIVTRLIGLTAAASAAHTYLLARFGIGGMLERGKMWRFLLYLIAVGIGTLGGFRSALIVSGMTFLLVFYFEGLVRSKYTVWLVFSAILGATLLVPFSERLPLSTQRALSVVPGLELRPEARESAKTSSEWRLNIWKIVLPQIPQYFLLGKGLGITAAEVELGFSSRRLTQEEDAEHIIAVGNLHNGPLTLLLFFGIWGAIAWLWFMIASIRALYFNCRYGEDHLRNINTYLLANFIVRMIMYLLVAGDIRIDFLPTAAVVGLSLALNHGIRKPARPPAPRPIPIRIRPRMNLVASPSRQTQAS